METYLEVWKKENDGKKYKLFCPSCKGRKLNGSAIFLYCLDCCWIGQIQEISFEEEKD